VKRCDFREARIGFAVADAEHGVVTDTAVAGDLSKRPALFMKCVAHLLEDVGHGCGQ